jgi:hypothetical protein
MVAATKNAIGCHIAIDRYHSSALRGPSRFGGLLNSDHANKVFWFFLISNCRFIDLISSVVALFVIRRGVRTPIGAPSD